ncbi:MAG: ABC transporter permease [Chloroflexi bacterium]|nr:ABC transporter permease [Chloroflexota bacterium]
MGAYILRRMLYIIPVTLGVVTVAFVLLRLVPGDPITLYYFGQDQPGQASASAAGLESESTLERLREAYNLDKSMPHQYVLYLADLVRGDLGISIRKKRPVLHIIGDHWPATMQITLVGMSVAIVVGLTAGILSAIKHHTIIDYAAQMFAIIGVSVPQFLLGLVLIFIFAILWRTDEGLGMLPAISNGHGKELILPSITLGLAASAILARLTRSSMLDVMSRDYIRTARAKGLRERAVIWMHALRNALIPIVTVIGLEFGGLLGGAVVIETVFTRQGLGFQLINSINQRDYPIVQGLVVMAALVYALMNLVVDVLYTYIDPRVRLEESTAT